MRFTSVLKSLSKKPILLFIVIVFIISWFLLIFALYFVSNVIFSFIVLIFIVILTGFTFLLLIFSIFVPIEKMGLVTIVLVAVLTVPIIYIFSGIINLFYLFCIFANYFITAFFAFKFSMDTSIGLDNYLYKKKGSRKFTRVLEFVLFLFLYLWLLFLIIRFFRSSSNPSVQNSANIFIFLLWINLVLILFVVLRLIFTKKLAAYISFFFVWTFLYVLYLLIDLWASIIFSGHPGYSIFSFFIDLFLFIYIIGSIFDRVDYIKEKIKIFRVSTIALFVILMKLYVQLIKIIQGVIPPPISVLIFQAQVLFYFFIIFTLIIGLYTIFAHKEGKKSRE